MGLTLSVIIAARNCVDRISETITPWKTIATEVIVVDQESTDGTAEKAKEAGAVVISNNPLENNFDLNRKLGLQKAKGDWLLYIDTDERPTTELLEEIKGFLSSDKAESVSGVRIPNLFYFLGKPLKHGLYRKSSAEIRMFRNGKWDYPCEEGFHRGVSVKGQVVRFKHPYKHFNVNTLSEWFLKTNQYTEHDALKNFEQSSKPSFFWAFFQFKKFIFKHYIVKLGFLDGWRGLVSIFYFAMYHLTLRLKILEKKELKSLESGKDYLPAIPIPKR